MFDYKKLTTDERIKRVKIQLQEQHPFFARLILNLNITEDVNGILPNQAGMGVDARGNLTYKKSFVDSLTDPELKFCLAHEVGHVMLGHLMRLGNRNMMGWNIAADLVVNSILRQNNFTAPKGILMPEHDDTFDMKTKIIKEISKNPVEQVYDQLPKETKQQGQTGMKGQDGKDGKGKGQEGYEGQFDHHDFQKMSEQDKKKAAEHWNDQIIDAAAYAKNRGNIPSGLERYIKDILEPTVNWKQLLQKYVSSSLPFDFTYNRPSKKSISTGYYMPSVLKEMVEFVVHVDTSGSIQEKELREFLAEVIGMARSFSNVRMTLIECDCAVQQVLEMKNGNINTILEMKIKGGGGTSHKVMWDYVNDKLPTCKLLISLTDGYSDIEIKDNPRYDVIFVVSKGGAKDEAFPFGRVIQLED